MAAPFRRYVMLPIKSTAVALTVALSAAAANPTVGPREALGASPHPTFSRDTGYRVVDSALAATTFDSAWRTIGVTLERRGVTRLDWPGVRRELLPRAVRAESDSALRAVIDDMLARIGESHFALLPAQTAPGGDASPNTSASKRQIRAPRFHASPGKPALRHVCVRNVSRSQFHSTAT